ncbi:MAG TPA: hypothetical protein VF177_03430 [Anaerolineae bacterium]
MSRIVLVLLIVLAVLASPMAVLRCRLSAQQQGHAVDPCLDEAPAHSPPTHASQSYQIDLLDAIAGDIVISAPLRATVCREALSLVQGESSSRL